MLYHISKAAGLKVLKPHILTHQKPYRYAIKNVVTGHYGWTFVMNIVPNQLFYNCSPQNKNPPNPYPTEMRFGGFYLSVGKEKDIFCNPC